MVIFLVHCILSKTLNTFSQALNTKQMISLTLECQERNKENDRLKNWETVNTTETQQKKKTGPTKISKL